MSANFDREYRLAAGKAGGMGFEIGEKSKSQPVPLHINFSIERTDLETQNTGRVTVWNLNKEHLATLDEKDCVLSLKAGYGSRMPLIFAGIVTNCVTTHDGADRKTEIEVVRQPRRDPRYLRHDFVCGHGELEDHLRRCGKSDGCGGDVFVQR